MGYSYLDYAHLPAGRRSRLAGLTHHSAGRIALLDTTGTFRSPMLVDAPHDAFRRAAEASLSAVATSLGVAQTYYPDYAELVPLVLDVNGPHETAEGTWGDYAMQATVEDALRLNAQAARFTLELERTAATSQLRALRALLAEAHPFDVPVILRAPSRDIGSPVERARAIVHVGLHHGADLIELPAAALRNGAASGHSSHDGASHLAASVPVLARLDAGADPIEAVRQERLAMELGCHGLAVPLPASGRSYAEALASALDLHATVIA